MRIRLRKSWQLQAAVFLLSRKISAMSACAAGNLRRRWFTGAGHTRKYCIRNGKRYFKDILRIWEVAVACIMEETGV